MTVRELIDALADLPLDAPVFAEDGHSWCIRRAEWDEDFERVYLRLTSLRSWRKVSQSESA